MCYDCPLALDMWALCPAISDAACDIYCSKKHEDTNGIGVVIVQGAYVVADPLLVRHVDATIWLEPIGS